MASDVHCTIEQDQEGSGGKHQPVGDDRSLAATEQPLTVA